MGYLTILSPCSKGSSPFPKIFPSRSTFMDSSSPGKESLGISLEIQREARDLANMDVFSLSGALPYS